MKRDVIEKNRCLSSSLPLMCVSFQRSGYAVESVHTLDKNEALLKIHKGSCFHLFKNKHSRKILNI